MRRQEISAALFLGVTTVGSFWLAGALPGSGDAQVSPPQMSAVAPLDAGRTIRASGYVEPQSQLRRLSFDVDGVIGDCRVELGQMVRAGEVLATLHDEDAAAAVVVAEGALAVAKAKQAKMLSGAHPQELEAAGRRVETLRERQQFAKHTLERETALYAKAASSRESLDAARTTSRAIDAELAAALAEDEALQTQVRTEDRALADAEVELAAAHLEAARAYLRNSILTAPISGTIVEILRRQGEAVRGGSGEPVLILADLASLRVRAEVDERFVSLVHEGQAAVLYGRGVGDRRVPARVALVKTVMGKKTVFTQEAEERKDLDVVEVLIQPTEPFHAPVGLRVDVDIALGGGDLSASSNDKAID